jgi:hypothetical protein
MIWDTKYWLAVHIFICVYLQQYLIIIHSIIDASFRSKQVLCKLSRATVDKTVADFLGVSVFSCSIRFRFPIENVIFTR